MDAARFWSMVDIRSPAECWEWKRGLNSGYGQYTERVGSQWKWHIASRVAWELTFGPIPEGLFALHHCDNRKCCNPYHLFLGTKGDNNTDKMAKGRQGEVKQGEEHPMVKLTADSVRHIRASPLPAAELADIWGVHKSTIERIKSRKLWKHIT